MAEAMNLLISLTCGSPPRMPEEVFNMAQATYDNLTPAGTLDGERLGILSDRIDDENIPGLEWVLNELRLPQTRFPGWWIIHLLKGGKVMKLS